MLKGKVDLFNKFFYSVFSERFSELVYEDVIFFIESMVDDLLCLVVDVYKVFSFFDVNKVNGFDVILFRILKECVVELVLLIL